MQSEKVIVNLLSQANGFGFHLHGGADVNIKLSLFYQNNSLESTTSNWLDNS